MTLLSDSFLAIPSTANAAITVNDTTRSSTDSQSPSSSATTSTVNGPTPSQVLAMTIKKKRRILRCRDRDLRVELLLTSTIRRLCQEIGDHLRTRRMASMKRKSAAISSTTFDEENDPTTPTVRQHATKRSCFLVKDGASDIVKEQEVGPVEGSHELPKELPSSVASVGTLAAPENEQKSEADSNGGGQRLRKRKAVNEENDSRKRVESEDNFNEKDPFGMDDFFRSLRSCRVGGSNR
jgi:hypothetical protein